MTTNITGSTGSCRNHDRSRSCVTGFWHPVQFSRSGPRLTEFRPEGRLSVSAPLSRRTHVPRGLPMYRPKPDLSNPWLMVDPDPHRQKRRSEVRPRPGISAEATERRTSVRQPALTCQPHPPQPPNLTPHNRTNTTPTAERRRYEAPQVMGRFGRFSAEVRERLCGWWSRTATSTARSGQRSAGSPRTSDCCHQTLRDWVRQSRRDAGPRPGLTSEERARVEEVEREYRQLRPANTISRQRAANFVQAELGRRPK